MRLEVPSLTEFSQAARPTLVQKLKSHFSLGKPGIALSVLIATFAGYAVGVSARGSEFSASTLFHTLFGTFLVSMGAGALNMVLESDIDALMDRTKARPIPSGLIPSHRAFLIGGIISSFGVAHLAGMVNLRAAFAAAVSLMLYLVLYTPLKKSSRAATAVGAASGALPPVIGWNASGADLGWEVFSLFGILFLWQFPHFLALFRLYRDDFKRGGIKVLFQADESGVKTARAVLGLTIALAAFSYLPAILGLGTPAYIALATALNGYLIYSAARFVQEPIARARRYFLSTVVYLPVLFLALAFRP